MRCGLKEARIDRCRIGHNRSSYHVKALSVKVKVQLKGCVRGRGLSVYVMFKFRNFI